MRVTPSLTVDCVIIYNNQLVCIRRGKEPFKGGYALPGGYVEVGESVEDACRREVLEETNLQVENIKLVGVYSDPTRDPRNHCVSIAFCVEIQENSMKAGDDAASVHLIENWMTKDFAFDHGKIIQDAMELLGK